MQLVDSWIFQETQNATTKPVDSWTQFCGGCVYACACTAIVPMCAYLIRY